MENISIEKFSDVILKIILMMSQHWMPLSLTPVWPDLWPYIASQVHNELTHLPLDKMATILADDNFKCIFLNENDRITIRISLKFVPRSPIDNKPALV